jgi:hypothetical protein
MHVAKNHISPKPYEMLISGVLGMTDAMYEVALTAFDATRYGDTVVVLRTFVVSDTTLFQREDRLRSIDL